MDDPPDPAALRETAIAEILAFEAARGLGEAGLAAARRVLEPLEDAPLKAMLTRARAEARARVGERRLLPGVSDHARAKCIERYGFDLPDEEWLRLWLELAEGRALAVRVGPDGSAVYAVPTPFLPGPLLLAYDPERGVIKTALPDAAKRAMNLRRRVVPGKFLVGRGRKGGRREGAWGEMEDVGAD